jgi:ribosome-interacting GTPase 1
MRVDSAILLGPQHGGLLSFTPMTCPQYLPQGAKDGKGRGRQVISTARTCNLILIVLDCLKPLTHKRLIEHELEVWRG